MRGAAFVFAIWAVTVPNPLPLLALAFFCAVVGFNRARIYEIPTEATDYCPICGEPLLLERHT